MSLLPQLTASRLRVAHALRSAAIVREIRAVFDVYGISIDVRHLGLVADYMTFGVRTSAAPRAPPVLTSRLPRAGRLPPAQPHGYHGQRVAAAEDEL